MSPASLRLIGNVSDICRPVYSSDNQEQVTVSVEGAEPLYAEIRKFASCCFTPIERFACMWTITGVDSRPPVVRTPPAAMV